MDTTCNQEYSPHANANPNRSDVLALYKELRRMNNDYNPSNDKLIALLGGIDAVMETVLNAPNHTMSGADCLAMHQYLEEPLLEETAPVPTNDTFKWTLDPNHNMLYQISPFVHRHLFSKPVLAIIFLVVLFVIAGTYFLSICPGCDNYYYITSIASSWLVIIAFLAATLLRVNLTMARKIANTSDIWVILVSVVISIAYWGIYQFSDSDDRILQILWFCSWAIWSFLFYAVICCFDGIEGFDSKFKITVLAVAALWCGVKSFRYGFILEDKVIKIPKFGEYGRVSVTGNVSNYYQILAIFLTKMAINTFRKGSKRCVLVKYSPFIDWASTVNADHDKTRQNVELSVVRSESEPSRHEQ